MSNTFFTFKKTFIIAEIGQNHQGDINIAKKLIDAAKISGADCVKFQKTNLTEKFNKAALEKPYSNKNSWGSTYGEHKTFLEFTIIQFEELQDYARDRNILFSASAMDHCSLKYLASLNVPFIKIGSGDCNNFDLIETAAKTNIPLIISTGMQSFETVKIVYNLVSRYHKNFALLHCISAYPTPLEETNLKVIELYKMNFSDIYIGYSGHEIDFNSSVAAVAIGAKESHLVSSDSIGSLKKMWKQLALQSFDFDFLDDLEQKLQYISHDVKRPHEVMVQLLRSSNSIVNSWKKLKSLVNTNYQNIALQGKLDSYPNNYRSPQQFIC